MAIKRDLDRDYPSTSVGLPEDRVRTPSIKIDYDSFLLNFRGVIALWFVAMICCFLTTGLYKALTADGSIHYCAVGCYSQRVHVKDTDAFVTTQSCSVTGVVEWGADQSVVSDLPSIHEALAAAEALHCHVNMQLSKTGSSENK